MIIEWNKEVTTEEDYLTSSEGMQKMAASCMLLRDHIAHGYFNIDSSIVFDVSINEIPSLRQHLMDVLGAL